MFSFFRSKQPAPKLIITVEETEKFLKDQMRLIKESEGIDPDLLPVMFGKERTREENMRRIANQIKWAIKEGVKPISLEKAMQCDTDVLVSKAFAKRGEKVEFLQSMLFIALRFEQSILGDELKKNFIHNLAVSLHKVTKDWVSKNGGWVETYIDAAEDQGIRNIIEANRKNVEFLANVLKFCLAGVGLYALFRWGLTEEVSPGLSNAFSM
ncbi:MAG: hypothetical protein ACYCQI_14560 [Gammaproteobacteria bacterium]